MADKPVLTGAIHCRCWKDGGEPCCWCLDDTEDSESGPDLPACTHTRPADCITDLRDAITELEDELDDEIAAKDHTIAAVSP